MKPFENLSLENIEGEVWKEIPEYEGIYQVSNMGRIKSCKRKIDFDGCKIARNVQSRILKQCNVKDGYKAVQLNKENKANMRFAHRLVLMAFVGTNKEMMVDHINMDITDNRLCNLEYVTGVENVRRYRVATSHKYTSKYIGVAWNKRHKKWRAALCHNRKITHCGFFDNEYDAHLAYEEKRKFVTENPQHVFLRNKPKSSAYKGVTKDKDGWCAQIRVGENTIHIGTYTNEIDAHYAFLKAVEIRKVNPDILISLRGKSILSSP